ncbi:MAG: PaaD-like zinc ribbon domain-containing protein [Actinomycetota bacterium]
MSDAKRGRDQTLGASVVLTGWDEGREADVRDVLSALVDPPDGDLTLPFVAVEKTSVERAERARAALEAAGAVVEVRDAWVARDPGAADRPPCPHCGSDRTQAYTHAGPGARKQMQCTTCGRTFRPRRV